MELTTVHTAEVAAGALSAVRDLLDSAFDGEFTDSDWEHCLGGIHVIAWENDEVAGHAAVVQRRLYHAGGVLRTGYVEGVGVRGSLRGRGVGGLLMGAVERVIGSAYELGALSTTDEALPFYRRRGWRPWEGPTSALGPDGVVRTVEDDGSVLVLPVDVELDVAGALACDWRDGDLW